MTTVINCEREALDFDHVPELMKDTQLPTREAAVSMSSQLFNEREFSRESLVHDVDIAPKSDELEALWPGVHHEFEPPQRKGASFYMTIGFMAGSALSLLGVFGYSAVSQVVASKGSSDKQVMVANLPAKASSVVPGAPQSVTGQDGTEILVPATNSYQVQPGDTLAGIAQRNYKRVSPRLLDQICRFNNMRNANVLSLGQKLNLPEYRPQANQIAATSAAQIQ